MRLVSYEGGFGRVDGNRVIPMGPDILDYLRDGAAHDGSPVALAEVRLRAPVPRPGKIVAIGFNYRDHQVETGLRPASEPALFVKYANSVIGPREVIRVPSVTSEPDYEAELAVVIVAQRSERNRKTYAPIRPACRWRSTTPVVVVSVSKSLRVANAPSYLGRRRPIPQDQSK